ncbi:hypothetical protein Tco_1029573 [Tanacetum coccineum]|uniref:Uncharacterized protein n=1 Tax=Tanacetum coccineum TaxID=301880 RepID=A0ABQ5G5L0_9ASTR
MKRRQVKRKDSEAISKAGIQVPVVREMLTHVTILSLHKFPVIIFNDDDTEERTSRWVNKCVKKFNPYARYGVEHWKNPHAKIFYIKKQNEPRKPKEEVYSNSKIIQVIKTYWELGHEHKFITKIVARRANDCIVSITGPDYKNLNKNDIEDIYLMIINGKVPDYAETGLLWSLLVFIRSSVIWERVHDFQLGIESLKSYNNDIKYSYVQRELTNDEVEYLKLFEEEIEIIMENLPPPNNDPNIPEDEHAPVPEHAPIAPNPLPIQPNNYLANDEADPEEEPEEEEEPISEQAPAAAVGFAPQWRMKRTNRVKNLTKQMWDRLRVESSSSRRLERNDMRMDSFDDDLTALDSTFREQMQEMKKLVAGLNEQFQQIQERDLRAENEMLRIRLRFAEEKAEYNHMEAEETSYDPFTNPTSRPRRVDPYVMVRDNAVRADAAGDHGGESVDTTALVIDAGEEKDNKGDDVDAAKDSQPLETMAPTRRSQTNPQPPLTQEAVDQLVRDGIKAAIRAERESVREEANRVGGPARGLAAVPVAQECTFVGFMKCGPTQFHRTEGAVGLCH